MNKKQKTRTVKLTMFLIAAFVAAASIGGAALFRSNSYAATDAETSAAQAKSLFSFTGADGWRGGPSNGTSMALFGNAKEDGSFACFTSMEFKTGTVDVAAELQKHQVYITAGGDTMAQTGIIASTLQTASGQKQYDLYQYALNGGEGNENLMGGLELGYIQLDKGYVQVDGHCNTTEELASTIPALQAYKLHK